MTGIVGLLLLQVIKPVVANTMPDFEIEDLFGNSRIIATGLAAVGVLILYSSARDHRKGGDVTARRAVDQCRSRAVSSFPRSLALGRDHLRQWRHLSSPEIQALLDAPEPVNRAGIRDRAMLHLCYAAGLRVSELVGLRLDDLTLQPQPSVVVHGKGRKERCLPLWKTTTVALRAWLAVRGVVSVPELFVSRSGFEYILEKYVRLARQHCPSLVAKRVSPHVLRHSCALTVLEATKDIRKVSLWLGHASIQTTEMYTRADPSIRLEALEATAAPCLRSGRFRATDKLIASLTTGSFMRRPKRAA